MDNFIRKNDNGHVHILFGEQLLLGAFVCTSFDDLTQDHASNVTSAQNFPQS